MGVEVGVHDTIGLVRRPCLEKESVVIILSLVERDPEAVKRLLLDPPEGCDAIEVRLDALRGAGAAAPARWFPGGAAAARPVIAACRRPKDGGLFRGGERARREVLLAAARAGVAWVDAEYGTHLSGFADEIAPAKLLVSHHDRRTTRSAAALAELYRRMAAVKGAAAVKIVTTAQQAGDILEIRALLRRAAGRKVPLAAFAMGDPGIASRILGPSWGSWATYVCLRRGAEAAPGQITLEEAEALYRINDIDEETHLTGITGWPIGHSLSPVMHNAAYHHSNINFRYLPFPAPRLEGAIKVMKGLGVRGLSVTAPHKIAIARRLSRLEPAARAIGASNTVLFAGRKLIGFNTDAEGTLGAVKERIDPAGRVAAVVGAGGSARAIAVGLAKAGARIIVCARRERPGADLARFAGGRYVPPRRLARETYDILINATPVGMDGRSMPVPAAAVKGSLVGDLVYRPVQTPLLKAAMAHGIPTFGGLDVLLMQGIAQYAIFTGRAAPVEVMREALRLALVPAAADGE